jgi:hypothetical protein
VLDEDGVPTSDELKQLTLPKGVALAPGLLKLTQQAVQHFKRIKPTMIALVDTTKNNQWLLSSLRPRVELEAAIMFAAAMVEVPAERVSPHDACKPLKVLHNHLAAGARARFDFSPWTYPNERAEAAAAAWCLSGVWPPDQS